MVPILLALRVKIRERIKLGNFIPRESSSRLVYNDYINASRSLKKC